MKKEKRMKDMKERYEEYLRQISYLYVGGSISISISISHL
jgi:hypothetical protein